jgi:AraC family transcriptional regulator
MALTRRTLLKTPDLEVRHVACSAETHASSDVEGAAADTLVFPLAGLFTKRAERAEPVVADPTTVVLFAEGREHRIGHPRGLRDTSLAVQLDPGVLRPALVELAGVDHLGDRRLAVVAPLAPAALVLRSLWVHRLRLGVQDGLEGAEVGLALLAAAARRAARRAPSSVRRPETARRRRDQAEAVRSRLLAWTGPPPSLSDLGSHAAASPFHLARVFRAHVGLPVHEYYTRLRIERALGGLLDTDRDIGRIALDLGFSSHSHFTHAFRRRTGTTPSRLRWMARHGTAEDVRTIVTAVSTAAR